MRTTRESSSLLRRIAAWMLCGVCWLALGGVGRAQSNFGSLRGQVRDAAGSAAPGATIRITDAGTKAVVTVTSGSDGAYVAPSLRPVVYDLEIEARGFRKTAIRGVKIDTAKDANLDISLEPGEVSDTVTITGEAPLLQTDSSSVTRTVDQRTIVDVPLNGRNTLELALILPGAAGSAGSELTGTGQTDVLPGRELIINGGRPGSTQFYADGSNVTSVALARTTVSFTPDTIQEFSVQQSNYSAQYSQAGGAIIQQTTKSGTSEIHGTLYWFHRQKALTANPFNTERLAIFNNDARPPLRRQQLGFNVGGPVTLPKKVFGPLGYQNRDRGDNYRTFFFASYEPTRELSSLISASTIRVPTEAELNGDFSQSRVYFRNAATGAITTQPWALLYNQFARLPGGALALRDNPNYNRNLPVSATNPLFANSGFPLFNPNDPDAARRGRVLVDANGQSYVNAQAQAVARLLYPRANITDAAEIERLLGANYAFFRTTINNDDRYTVRLDHRLNEKHQVSGRYTYQPLFGDRFNRDTIDAFVSEKTDARNILVTWTATFTPRLVSEFRAGYVFGNFSRSFTSALANRDLTTELLDIGGPGAGRVNLIGFGAAQFFGLGAGSPTAANNQSSGAGFGGLGFAAPQNVGLNTEHTYQLSDDFTWNLNNKTIRFGFAGSLLMLNQAALGYGLLAGGRYNFSRNQTGNIICDITPLTAGTLPGCPSTLQGGDTFASFLLGVPSGLTLQTENLANPYYYRWRNYGLYLQNDWKLKPNLTLNLGLRYQSQSPRWEKNNLQGALNLGRLEANPFSLAEGNVARPAPVFEFAGVNGRSRYLTPVQHADLEPRFGFAWTPGFRWNEKRRFVVRGGYGLQHATLMGNDREPIPNLGSQTFGAFRGYSVTLGANDNASPTVSFTACGLAICDNPRLPMQFGYNNVRLAQDPQVVIPPANGILRPGDLAAPFFNGAARQDPRYRAAAFLGAADAQTPVIQNFSLQLQYEWMTNTVVTVGYQGSRGTHLFQADSDLNRPDPFTGAQLLPGYNGRFGNGAIYLVNATGGASTYHAGTFEIERRFHRGLQFRFNYTWSKAMDDGSGGIRFPFPNNSFNNCSVDLPCSRAQAVNSRDERAIADYDTPHIFNLVTLWELPFGKGRKFFNRGGAVEAVAGGWQLNTIGRLRSGYPIAVGLGRGNSLNLGIGGGSQRPDLIAGAPLRNPDWTPENAAFTSYVNPRAFAWPDPGKGGNSPRNHSILRLPWVDTFDTSLFKRFHPFGEGKRFFEFRAEVFNIFNNRTFSPGGVQTNLFSGGDQNQLINALPNGGTAANVFGPVVTTNGAPVGNRYRNLSAPGVWDALIAKSRGVAVDAAIAALPGPGPNGVGCPANAPELARSTGTGAAQRFNGGSLSPACTAREITMNGNFYVLNHNGTRSRTFQLSLKFYF
jgi:Carboxypeptidase regulatory-like domain